MIKDEKCHVVPGAYALYWSPVAEPVCNKFEIYKQANGFGHCLTQLKCLQ